MQLLIGYSYLFSSPLYCCVEYFLSCSNPKAFGVEGTNKDPIFDSLRSIAKLPPSPSKNDDRLDDFAIRTAESPATGEAEG